jgi:hypothetical protein
MSTGPPNITLNPSTRSSLLAMQRTSSQMAVTQMRLSTGKKVNTALDNANSFFAAQALKFNAADTQRLMDGLRQNMQVIKTAQQGIDAITKLLEQTQAITLDALSAAETLPATSQTLSQTPLYTNGGANSTAFNGSNQAVNVPDNNAINLSDVSQRTIEIVISPGATSGRQVLWEEGGNTNGLEIYIYNGSIYFNGRSVNGATTWGPFNISAPITAGQTYHVALQLDVANQQLRGYLNGQLVGTGAASVPLVAHDGDIGIGAMRG